MGKASRKLKKKQQQEEAVGRQGEIKELERQRGTRGKGNGQP